MIDSSKKHKRQLAFEFQNSCVFEKRGKTVHFLGMVKSSFSINGHNARVVQYSQIDSIGVSGDKKGLHWYQWYDWYQWKSTLFQWFYW